jgi:hypothetical protein
LWGSSSTLSSNKYNHDGIIVDNTVTDNNDVIDADQIANNGADGSNSSSYNRSKSKAGENESKDFIENDFKNSKKIRRLSVMYEICQTMAISAGAQSESHMLYIEKFPPQIPEGYLKEEDDEENKYAGSPVLEAVENASKSLILGIKKLFETPKISGNRNTVDLSGGSGMFSENNSVKKEVIKVEKFDYQKSLENLVNLLKNDSAEFEFNGICPNLLSIKPSVRVMRRVSERYLYINIHTYMYSYIY